MSSTKWKKILYEDQGVPDNYVPDTFLDDLRKNCYVREYFYWKLVLASGAITQQISSVCIFALIYWHMSEQNLTPSVLLKTLTAIFLGAYTTLCILSTKCNVRTAMSDAKTAVIFVTFTLWLSPILISLTETISTDTVVAMTTASLGANLFLTDYTYTEQAQLSLNAAMFASVCLASRLASSLEAFTLVVFALGLFALWPKLQSAIKDTGEVAWGALTMIVVVTTLLCLWPVSKVATTMVTIAITTVTFLCPAGFVLLQPYKNNIYGPWDEAVVKT